MTTFTVQSQGEVTPRTQTTLVSEVMTRKVVTGSLEEHVDFSLDGTQSRDGEF